MKKLLFSIFLLNAGFAVATPSKQDIAQILQQAVEMNIQAPMVVQPAQPQAHGAVLPQISKPTAQVILASAIAMMAYFGMCEENLYMNGIGFTFSCVCALLATYILLDS